MSADFELTAVTPIDGRYHKKTEALGQYFSEWAFFKYRVKVEVNYFIALSGVIPQMSGMSEDQKQSLLDWSDSFSVEDAKRVKELEAETNHDIKAVEYFIKERTPGLAHPVPAEWMEFIHFGLTSQDINNTSIPLMVKDAIQKAYLPAIEDLIEILKGRATEWRDVAMLARTHGQPATPTTVGKEFMVFIERLLVQLRQLRAVPFSCKFGGATGGFNAHKVAFPAIDWLDFANKFTNGTLGLERSQFTTQVEHYDNLASLMDAVKRINTILIDFCRDTWTYISMGYFKQKIIGNEVGSSAMPHKVNPIDFENAEGNLGVATALCEHFSHKLPISRLQRDLTDSTVMRNLGTPFGHILVSISSLKRGIGKLQLNAEAITADLDANWAICAEPLQTILRREAFPKPYEALKDLTRVEGGITQQTLAAFVDGLEGVGAGVKGELKAVTPHNYLPIIPEMPQA